MVLHNRWGRFCISVMEFDGGICWWPRDALSYDQIIQEEIWADLDGMASVSQQRPFFHRSPRTSVGR